MFKIGYKSESGTIWFTLVMVIVSVCLPHPLLIVALLPLWVLVSRRIAAGAHNTARPPNDHDDHVTDAGRSVDNQGAPRLDRFVTSRHMTVNTRPIAVVTGTNSGIGFETAVGLAVEGYEVVVTCRTAELGMHTAERVRATAERRRHAQRKRSGTHSHYVHLPSPIVVDGSQPMECDNFAGIRDFVAWLDGKYGQRNVQVLVNNAGAMQRRLSFSRFEPQLESHVAINFLGPLLLTELMLPILERNGGRVVYVSSEAHRFPQMVLDQAGWLPGALRHGPNLHGSCVGILQGKLLQALEQLNQGEGAASGALAGATVWKAFARYGTSKLLNTYHAHVIARRYRNASEEAHRVYACSLHPGCVVTNFSNDLLHYRVLIHLLRYAMLLFLKTSREGAQTSLHCAMCPREELELYEPPVVLDKLSKTAPPAPRTAEAVSPYFVECRNKTAQMLLAYGWDVEEAEHIVAWGRRLVHLDETS